MGKVQFCPPRVPHQGSGSGLAATVGAIGGSGDALDVVVVEYIVVVVVEYIVVVVVENVVVVVVGRGRVVDLIIGGNVVS